jgi:hypothetical protein
MSAIILTDRTEQSFFNDVTSLFNEISNPAQEIAPVLILPQVKNQLHILTQKYQNLETCEIFKTVRALSCNLDKPAEEIATALALRHVKETLGQVLKKQCTI